MLGQRGAGGQLERTQSKSEVGRVEVAKLRDEDAKGGGLNLGATAATDWLKSITRGCASDEIRYSPTPKSPSR